jgi:hypothetical protein
VRSVHKKVHEVRHGKDPSEMGGMNIESQSTLMETIKERDVGKTKWMANLETNPEPGGSDTKKFFEFYLEELKDQFRGGPTSKK